MTERRKERGMRVLRGQGQMSESMALAVLLTLAGGFQDAYSYNCRGHVFANAQTGNIVLLGQNLAQGSLQSALRYVFPLAAFLAGVYVTEWVRHLCSEHRKVHWRQIVLGVEFIMLLLAGLLPRSLNILANVCMSFACAMQVNSFRKFRGFPSATTMCIGNMRSAMEALGQYHITKDREQLKKSSHYGFIILVFAVGAALGTVFCMAIGDRAIWIAAGMLLAGMGLMFIQEETGERR